MRGQAARSARGHAENGHRPGSAPLAAALARKTLTITMVNLLSSDVATHDRPAAGRAATEYRCRGWTSRLVEVPSWGTWIYQASTSWASSTNRVVRRLSRLSPARAIRPWR